MDELIAELQRRGLVVVPRDSLEPMRGSRGGGGAVFTGIQPGSYSVGGGSITVNSRGQVISIRPGGGGGGGGVVDLANIGGEAEIYRPPLTAGDIAELRTLVSPGSTIDVTQAADQVQLDVAGLSRASTTFTDNSADAGGLRNVTVATLPVAPGSMLLVNGHLSITVGTPQTASFQIIATSDGTAIGGASDVVQVDGPNALTTVALSGVSQSGTDAVLVFTVTGVGALATFTYTSEVIG